MFFYSVFSFYILFVGVIRVVFVSSSGWVCRVLRFIVFLLFSFDEFSIFVLGFGFFFCRGVLVRFLFLCLVGRF